MAIKHTAPRDRLTRATAQPKRMTVLSGKRLVAVAREPFVSLRAAAQQTNRDALDLVSARADALFRIPQTRHVADYVAVLSAQLRELGALPDGAAERVCNAAPELVMRCAAVLRNLTERATEACDSLVTDACLLSQLANRLPQLRPIAAQACETAIHLARLPRVPALRKAASPRPQSRIKTAVVAGAGPAGLAASIELLLRGVAVDLVDARDPWEYTRPVQMVVKLRALDQLAHLGVLERLRPHLSPMRADIEMGPGFHRSLPLGDVRDGDATRATRSGADFAKSSNVYIISMHELEKALFERALELGVRAVSHATIDIQGAHGPMKRYGVVAQRGEVEGRELVPNGETVSLGFPDLIVVAEGSRSQRRDEFGISWDKDDRPPKRGLAGLVNVDIGPESHTWSESGIVQADPVISVGHATSHATWSLVEVPAQAVINSPADAERVFLQRTSRALGKPLTHKDLLFGGTTLFPIENRIASSAVFFASPEQAVVAVGDAKGLGSPKIGLGMQYGISVDAMNLGRFVDNVDLIGFAKAGKLIDASIRDSVKIWHKRFI